MLKTYEAVVDHEGNIRLVDPVELPAGKRILITVLDEPPVLDIEAALLSEAALAEDWNRPEEDEAWSHLQPAQSS
jgi:hypothetical protein